RSAAPRPARAALACGSFPTRHGNVTLAHWPHEPAVPGRRPSAQRRNRSCLSSPTWLSGRPFEPRPQRFPARHQRWRGPCSLAAWLSILGHGFRGVRRREVFTQAFEKRLAMRRDLAVLQLGQLAKKLVLPRRKLF